MQSSNAKTRILLIEDDEDDYILTRDLLDRVPNYSYSLEWVHDPITALSSIRLNPYDVCLLDNRLGKQNGVDFLTSIGEVGAPMPIIMLTGVANRPLDEAAMKAGASDFLVKDQLSPELLERVIRFSVERFRLNANLELLAKYDSLTGLANRMMFQDFLAGAIARSDRGARQLGL
ncbi:MAG: PleD family two-component response regulator, partial [Gammaproteobacteria bacterium]